MAKEMSLLCTYGCGTVKLLHSGIYLCTRCQMSGEYNLQEVCD